MSGPPRVRSMNVAEPETRPVLVPAGNKARTVENRKSALKPLKKPAQDKETDAKEKKPVSAPPQRDAPSILKRQDATGIYRLSSMSASCSSDASSTDSSHSRASSSGRLAAGRRRSIGAGRRKQCGLKTEEVGNDGVVGKIGSDIGVVDAVQISLEAKKRCAWVTHNTESCYAAFHDEEWGVPVHDDKKLFELLSLSGALAELTWPAILSKRHMFREAFLDFDPITVSKLSEKKITCAGSPVNSLLSEAKLRGIIENARQVCKIIDEFGSFNKYIWNFVNQKPIISQFKYPRQVSVKTPKAEVISKDLVRRGFRSVGPTVIYSFMQAAGLTNDHLSGCFRFQECIAMAESGGKNPEEKEPGGVLELGLVSSIADLSFSS